MIRLDTTTLSLEAILAGAVTLNQLQCYVAYSDANVSSYIGGSKRTLTNGVTAVTICTAPTTGIVRDIDLVNIYNNDTSVVSLVVRLNDSGTFYTLRDVTLNPDDCLTYTHAEGWYVTDVSGSIKELLSGATFNNISISGVETYTTVGNQQVISQDASKFREGQQSTLTSGTAYTTNGNVLIMKAFTHNTGIDTSGNFTNADATDFCTGIFYGENDLLKGFSSSAAVTAGTTPTLSLTWSIDNKSGDIWNAGIFTQGDATATTGVSQLGGLFSSNTAAGANVIARKSNNGVNPAIYAGLKSRGTNASPSVISTLDQIVTLQGYGHDGTNYQSGGFIRLVAEGTISAGVVPSRWVFNTNDAAGANQEALRIDSSQNVLVMAPSGLGYGTGAGGAVVQATSRTTGVTLNTPTGKITMFTAAGSATPASFTVTNSTVGLNDVPVICVKSGATNTYTFMVTTVAAGSFVVTFWTTGGTASDTPILQFYVGKGVIA